MVLLQLGTADDPPPSAVGLTAAGWCRRKGAVPGRGRAVPSQSWAREQSVCLPASWSWDCRGERTSWWDRWCWSGTQSFARRPFTGPAIVGGGGLREQNSDSQRVWRECSGLRGCSADTDKLSINFRHERKKNHHKWELIVNEPLPALILRPWQSR